MRRPIKQTITLLCLAVALLLAVLLPASGSCENLRFVFLADSRSNTAPPDPDNLDVAINTPVLNAIITQINQLSPAPAFVIFGGDQSYRGCFTFSNTPYYMYQTWQNVMAQLQMPVYTVLGNHELYVYGQDGFFLTNQTAYQAQFTNNPNPANGPTGYGGLVYSFPSPGGDALFIVLDAYYLNGNVPSPNLHGDVDPVQTAWLTTLLTQTQATHKFVFMHPPYYLITENQSNQNPNLTSLWSLLDINHVNLYLCGHDHLYSRKNIDCSIAPNPQPSPPNPPVPPWQNNVFQLLCGTCGAPVDQDNPTVNPVYAWNVSQGANTYYFSVVDINGGQVTVTSYSGNTGDYQVFDTFSKISPVGTSLLLTD